ncbi:MAG: DsrE family protein [Deltaproteobacteria bacterium]|nr:DsrE family protein [Deltaproteobacteria bacterium]
MKVLFIIKTDDGETIYNAMRLANVGLKKGDEVSVFMLGKGVMFEQSGSANFDVMGQINQFGGEFFV